MSIEVIKNEDSNMHSTCEYSSNKILGKSNEELILPINDSLSGTLSTDFMCAKTTIMASPSLLENKFWLNGKEEIFENKRLQNCLKEVKLRANGNLPHLNWNISICSENNFPTAAGLASSAAGYACLVYALAQLYDIEGDISGIARLGSGSACRSVYGGWVRWCKGRDPTGADSIAQQIASASHWPEMRVLILVVNDERKKYSSTSGMKRSVETSELLSYRAQQIVPRKIERIIEAINGRHFGEFAQITMEDSNQFHAVCLDTFPPCVYMNDVSHAIVEVVHAYNKYKGVNKPEVEEFLSVISYVFPTTNASAYFKGIPVAATPITDALKRSLNVVQQKNDCLKYVIHSKIGDGPKVLTDPEEHLLNGNGIPKPL